MSVPVKAEGILLRRAASRSSVGLGDIVASRGGILVIAPHADDETLGCGLAIRAALAAGRDVRVLLLTDGAASHPHSREYPRDVLTTLRREEFARAVDALGDGLAEKDGTRLQARTLDLPDGSVPHDRAGLEEAFNHARKLADEIDARTIWATWGGDPHPDHLAASRLAEFCTREWSGTIDVRREYAVWGRFRHAGWSLRSDRIQPFEANEHLAAKREAIRAYASQLTPLILDDPTGFIMPPELVKHFALSREIFITPGSMRARLGDRARARAREEIAA